MSSDKSAKNTSDDSVMDVTKPGKSTPSASSRPIIVGHKPMIQDPMVNEAAPSDDSSESQKIEVNRTAPKVLQPLDQSLSAEAADDSEQDPDGAEPKEDINQPSPAADEASAETESTADQQPESQPTVEKTTETKIVETVVEKAANKKGDKSDKDDKAAKEKQEKINKLIEEKKYFVPVGEPVAKKRRGKILALILLILILVGGYAAADYFTDWPLPYEFFKNTQQETIADENSDQANSITAEPDQQDESANLPAGYAKFEDNDLGFSFAYPEVWGEPKVGPSVESDHLSSGSEFEISFSNNNKVTIGGQTADRAHDPSKGHGGVVYAGVFAGASQPNSYVIDPGLSQEQAKYQNSVIVSLPVFQESCTGIATVLIQNFSGVQKYPKIAFLYMHSRVDADNLTEADCEGDNYKNHINQAEVEELKTIAPTISPITSD